MKKTAVACMFILTLVLCISDNSYSAATTIGDLVDNFYSATDLQRQQITSDNQGKEMTAGGTVLNVGEYDFFDITNDIKGIYYQITTVVQKTKNNIPYQVIFLYRDRNKVENINKGESVQKDGALIRILDERLQITVWLFCGELSDKDKLLFNQAINP